MEDFLLTELMEEFDDSSDSDMSFLFSTSESESSESDDDYIVILAATTNETNNIQKFLEEVVPKYTDQEFMMHFRVTRSVFQLICNKFESSEKFKELDETEKFNAEMHIALFLLLAGNEAYSIPDIADRFNVSTGTARRIIVRVTYFISNLSNLYIKWPTDEEKATTSEYLKTKTGLSGVIGAIDGTHLKIDLPMGISKYFIDRNNVVSIQLQGICNEKKKFIDMFVGFPGSTPDNRVFESSDIYPNLPARCGQYYILGDSAYACSNYVVTPYRDNGHLSANQQFFNKKLSSGRVMIEQAFGLLKQRFRQLYHCKLREIEHFCHFVRACIVLHNLCEDNLEMNKKGAESNIEDEQNISVGIEHDGALRNRLCEEMSAK